MIGKNCERILKRKFCDENDTEKFLEEFSSKKVWEKRWLTGKHKTFERENKQMF